MKGKKFNKHMVTTVRFIYRFGLIKALLLCITVFAAAEEYKARWKGKQVHLRKGTTDFSVFRQVMVFEQYAIKGLPQKQVEVVVDLGANVGLSTVYFKKKYPQAQVIAVEPEIENYRHLVKNVSGLTGVHCLNNAIWHSGKKLGIFDGGQGEYSFQVKEESQEEKEAVSSVTITDIMEKFQLQKIDLLKIDIEGSEKELFSGNYANWINKVGCIVIEVHDWFRPGCAAAFFRAISSRDYSLSFKGENITVIFQPPSPEHHAAIESNYDYSTGKQIV